MSTAITQATTATTVSSSSNPVYAYAPLTFTVKSTSGGQPLASANITLTITPTGGTATSYPLTTDATGTASYAFTGLPAGTYLVAATYPATTNYSASTNSLTQIVTVDATTTTLVATPNPGIQNNPVTLGASVSESGGLTGPTGSVTFLDGTTPLGAGAFSPTPGAASEFVLTTSTLIPGVHTITANYTPSDPSFSASSATISLTINPQDFTFTATPPSISIQTEHHGALSLSLTAIGGFLGAISISCGTLPQYITCELNPTTVTLNSNGTASTANLTLDTDALLNFAQSHPAPGSGRPAWQAVFAGLLPLLLFGFGATRRRLPRALLPLLLLAAASLSLTACSGKYPGHTPPGTYTIPVTATGTAPGSTGPTTHTLNITLTVTP